MNLFADAFAWLFSPDRLTGPHPLPAAIAEHLFFTFVSVAIAAAIALPLGYLVGHTGKGRDLAVALSGAGRAVPSFGLILLLVLVFGVLHKPAAAITAFVLLAIPSILAGRVLRHRGHRPRGHRRRQSGGHDAVADIPHH